MSKIKEPASLIDAVNSAVDRAVALQRPSTDMLIIAGEITGDKIIVVITVFPLDQLSASDIAKILTLGKDQPMPPEPPAEGLH